MEPRRTALSKLTAARAAKEEHDRRMRNDPEYKADYLADEERKKAERAENIAFDREAKRRWKAAAIPRYRNMKERYQGIIVMLNNEIERLERDKVANENELARFDRKSNMYKYMSRHIKTIDREIAIYKKEIEGRQKQVNYWEGMIAKKEREQNPGGGAGGHEGGSRTRRMKRRHRRAATRRRHHKH